MQPPSPSLEYTGLGEVLSQLKEFFGEEHPRNAIIVLALIYDMQDAASEDDLASVGERVAEKKEAGMFDDESIAVLKTQYQVHLARLKEKPGVPA